MTREEAITLLRANVMVACDTSDKVGYGTPLNKAIEQASKMAIKSLEQEPCEDCVSRKAMLDYQQYLHGKMSNEENHKLWKFIKDLSPVTPTRKKGKWIKSNIGGAKVCSVCNAHMGLSVFKFCPDCGAEMEIEE